MFNETDFGFNGDKESFVSKRYIEELGYDTSLWVERKHQGKTRGQFFDNIEELLSSDMSIISYDNFDDYVQEDCGSVGYIDSLIIDNIDEDKRDKDFTFEELKNIVREHGEKEIIEALDNLKEHEKLYELSDCNGEYISTDKDSLILDNLADGQYYRVYNNVSEILEAINNKDDLAIVHIYNEMSNYDREKYSLEYSNSNSSEITSLKDLDVDLGNEDNNDMKQR